MAAYGSIQGHQGMVFDEVRSKAYYEALQTIITPESVVLDLGAGLGIFGLMAAKLGAKKVYLVEPAQVINVAKMFVADNNLEDRVECFQGRIEKVELPEKVDVIVSVFTGNFLLLEDLLPSLFFARDKYLKPGGHLIPSAGVMQAAPVSLPRLQKKHLDIWSEPYYDLDLTRGRKFVANSLFCRRDVFKNHSYLSAPVDLMSLDFTQDNDTYCRAEANFEINKNASCQGLAGWFKMKLGEHWLSTGPHDPFVHWTPVALPIDPAFEVKKGETLGLSLNRPPRGDWTWTISKDDQKVTRSTFISRTLSAEGPLPPTEGQPKLSPRNSVIRAILERFDGQTSIEEIVDSVLEADPDCQLTRRQVTHLALNFARQ